MIVTSNSSALDLLLRYHQFIKVRRCGTRDEIASMLGVGKNKLSDLRRVLINHGAEIRYNKDRRCYEYLNDFEFYVDPASKRA
jgi:hypothetical protein